MSVGYAMATDSQPIGLVELRLQAFRAVTRQACLRFDGAPVTIFFGGNHTGKSSVLNALDWLLFSKDCFQGRLVTERLRERVSWEIRNRHADHSLPTTCTALFSDGKATCEFTRSLSNGRSRSSTSLHVKTFEGNEIGDEVADRFISNHFPPSFRDFMSTVHLHQEVIRDVLTIKPEERGDAIDRLLGLAPLRDLARALKDARFGRFAQELDQKIGAFEAQLDAVRRDRQRRIDELVPKAEEHNLQAQDLTFERATRLAGEGLNRLKNVASKAGLPAPTVRLPEHENDVDRYLGDMNAALQSARTELPDLKELTKLTQRKEGLTSARATYEGQLKQRKEAREKLAELEKKKGQRAKLEREHADLEERHKTKLGELQEHDARAAAANDAIACIKALPSPSETTACPVCGQQVDGDELLEHLEKEVAERLDARSQALSQELDQLARKRAGVVDNLRDLGHLERELEAATDNIEKQREPIGKLLGVALTERVDPKALLDREIGQVEDQLGRRKTAAENRLSELKTVEDQYVPRILIINHILRERARLQDLGKIQQREEFKALRNLQGNAASLKVATETVGYAAATVSQSAAKRLVNSAGERAREVFVKVADHPVVRHIRLTVGEKQVAGILRNEYSIDDGHGRSPIPVLSQGDMNALALGLFIGLGSSANSLPLKLMILDDPTQSLATPQKERLAEVIDEVAESRQVIVATMDAEFFEALRSSVTKRKRVYEFRSWTPAEGPEIVELD